MLWYIHPYFKVSDIIENYIEPSGLSKINIFIDLMSITTGFYKKTTLLYELELFQESQELPTTFLSEFEDFANKLLQYFDKFDPFLIVFFDSGKCKQNTCIMPVYKSSRGQLFTEDKLNDFYTALKRYYLKTLYKTRSKYNNDKIHIIYSENYELDFIPYMYIRDNIAESRNCFNIILSADKDLLQICEFDNTIQITPSRKRKNKTSMYSIFTKQNAITYIYPKYNGKLTAEYIPTILSIAGDMSDYLPGIKHVGPARACHLIEACNLNKDVNKWEVNKLPGILKVHYNQILKNYRCISFEEQLKRIPIEEINKLLY